MTRTLCLRSLTIGLALLGWTSSASAILLIDTFGGFDSAMDNVDDGTSVTTNAARPVFGGQRRLVADKAGPAGSPIANQSLFTDGFGAAQLTFDQFGTATGTFGTAHLIYDGDAAGVGTSGRSDGTSPIPTSPSTRTASSCAIWPSLATGSI